MSTVQPPSLKRKIFLHLHPPESKTSGDREAKLLEVDSHFVTVKLLQAVKLPACHSKLVCAKAENSKVNHPVLFEEKKNDNKNLIVTICVTEIDKDKKLVVTIKNYGLQPVVLEEVLKLERTQTFYFMFITYLII